MARGGWSIDEWEPGKDTWYGRLKALNPALYALLIAEIKAHRDLYGGNWQNERHWNWTNQLREAVLSLNGGYKAPEDWFPNRRPVAAVGSPARLIYGTDRIAPQIAAVKVKGLYLYLLCVWCVGPVESVDCIYSSSHTLQPDRTNYLGTTNQGVDPWLADVIPGYADTLRGTVNGRSISLAYSVIKLKSGWKPTLVNQGPPDSGPQPWYRTPFPDVTAIIKGRKLYDPRDGTQSLADSTTWKWSQNPALALADFIYHFTGDALSWTSVEDAADYCDQQVNGKPRWTFNMTLAERRTRREWIDTIRAHGELYLRRRNREIQILPDRIRSPVATITEEQMVEGSFEVRRRRRGDRPSAVRVSYVIPSGTDKYTRGDEVVSLSNAEEGQTAWRETSIVMPGCRSKAEAHRHGVHRLNQFTLCRLEATFDTFDEGIGYEIDDTVTVQHPLGIDKVMRIVGHEYAGPGRWRITAAEYDEDAYSDTVVNEDEDEDTYLLSPLSPPAPTVAVAEEFYLVQAGVFGSRLRIDITPDAEYPYILEYSVIVTQMGGSYSQSLAPPQGAPAVIAVHQTITRSTSYVTPGVHTQRTFEVSVRLISTAGAVSPARTATITTTGCDWPPTDIAQISGFEIGGSVRLSWTPAEDLDLWRYELRYGPTSGSWATATLLDRVVGLRYETKQVPVGTQRIYVKALDTRGNYSVNAASCDVVVSLDSDAFLCGEIAIVGASYTSNMREQWYPYQGSWRKEWVSDKTATGNTVTDTLPNAMSTYTVGLGGYQTSFDSEWHSDVLDVGTLVFATWQATISAWELGGQSFDKTLSLSANNSDWTETGGLVAQASARYAKIVVRGKGLNKIAVRAPGAAIRADVVARTESGSSTSLASGGKTITLSGGFSKTVAITITPIFSGGAAARSFVIDDVTVGSTTSFDVYIFNASGTQVAQDFQWSFRGV